MPNQMSKPVQKVLILGIDCLRKKNHHQLVSMGKDYHFVVLQTNPAMDPIPDELTATNQIVMAEKTAFKRLIQVITLVKENRHHTNHAEIYPGGRFSFIYLLVCRAYGLKTITVERGDILAYSHSSIITKISLSICYKYADLIWYREYYMKEILEKMGCKNLVFIPNAVPIPDISHAQKKQYDLLWVNRLIPERKSEWILETMQKVQFSQVTSAIVGLLHHPKSPCYPLEKALIDHHPKTMRLFGFTDPSEFYKKSKFFILPSDLVFANYSLLEAMSYGLVPIVSEVSGTNQLVQNNKNGLTFTHTKEGFEAAVKTAINLTEAQYNDLSNAARKTIMTKFSIDSYQEKLKKMYQEITR